MTIIHKLLLEGTAVDEVTNNIGYLFVALIPTVAVFKNKNIIQYGLLIFCMVFIVIGMKRGAILVGVLSILYFLYFNFRYHRSISKVKVLIFSMLIALAGVYMVIYMMDTSDYFTQRIIQTENGGLSGRDYIYECFWNHFKNEMNTFKFLFGNGANATLDIGINYAHNDWLEIAINQGVFGLLIYAFYWLCFYKTIRQTKQNLFAKLVLTLVFISFFIMTLFSMSYTEYSIYSCTVFGYYLAHCREVEIPQ
ncbi:O-antigen ligase [Prevotella sp. DNF00663]|uniref:O-antigen ligase family protein n=1 Tax=Prevotella sp. DNF00663 TaxID=1384078 RepID=UPI0018D227EE|nr:O-antigen ligase family protein [Prevotella sp. DNF00663]